MSVANLSPADRQIEVVFTPRGVGGLTTFSSASVLVPESSQVTWVDIISQLFSTTGAGALEFRGHQDFELRPYENIQINQVVVAVAGTGTLSNGAATVTVMSGNGRIGAYLSVVDNATGDPTYIAIAPQFPAGG